MPIYTNLAYQSIETLFLYSSDPIPSQLLMSRNYIFMPCVCKHRLTVVWVFVQYFSLLSRKEKVDLQSEVAVVPAFLIICEFTFAEDLHFFTVPVSFIST